MKLIIDIDENSRKQLFDIANNGLDVSEGLENVMIMAIVNGKRLSKGQSKIESDNVLDEAVNKTGHWIEHNVKCYECSECHNTKSLYAGYKTDYCPNCGTKMEK